MAIDSISAMALSQTRSSGTPVTGSPRGAENPNPINQQELQAAQGPAQTVLANEQILPPEANPDREALDQAVSSMNSFVQNLQRDLQFEVDLDLGQTVISVVDRSTNEVIRQIPSEEAVARAQRLREQFDDAGGLLIKVQA